MARNHREGLLSDDQIHVIDIWVELLFPLGALLQKPRGQLGVASEDCLLGADLARGP